MRKFIIILILLAWPQIAWAHGVKLFATVEQQQVRGMAYFVGGDPAADCALALIDASGQELVRTITDLQGNFIIALPQGLRGPFSLHLLAGPGHSATLNLTTMKSDSYPAKITYHPIIDASYGSLLDQQLEQHLAPIRQQLIELQAASSALSMEKVIAGLGYIAGILGLLAYFHYRKRLRQLSEKNN